MHKRTKWRAEALTRGLVVVDIKALQLQVGVPMVAAISGNGMLFRDCLPELHTSRRVGKDLKCAQKHEYAAQMTQQIVRGNATRQPTTKLQSMAKAAYVR